MTSQAYYATIQAMLQITNTTNTLGNFVVRDYNLSYDNEYNEALIQAERSEAIRAATSQAISETLSFTLSMAKRAGSALLNGLDECIS